MKDLKINCKCLKGNKFIDEIIQGKDAKELIIKINKEKGTISFNNKEVKLQKIYFKKYTDVNKLNKDLARQLRFTQKKDKEEAEKHFFNALQIMYANKLGDINDENLKIINWLTTTYVPKMTSYDTSNKIDYETLILKRQEKNGLYDL